VKRLDSLWILAAIVVAVGCNKHPNKPDPTKGAVDGIVICSDTGKPARFAQVSLTPVPVKHDEPSDEPPLTPIEQIDTGLDGRFRIEAIPPGNYYAFGTLDGYLDPQRGIDFGKVTAKGTTSEQEQDAIEQWKDQLVEVKVALNRVSEITISLHRAAAIEGTVTYDDGSPAIGMHFQLLRKNAKKEWGAVGLPLLSNWTLDAKSDSHGHYAVDDLEAGEYIVCAMMPLDSEDVAPRVCNGNVFRRKDAAIVKVNDGETVHGIDIEIPLSGLHTVSGRVESVTDGHPPSQATVTLLYADDRETARKTTTESDGSFQYEYVPEGNYILRVSDANDPAEGTGNSDQSDIPAKNGPAQVAARRYQAKELPLHVQSDMKELDVPLLDEAAPKPQ
jgi:hypothetical protein